MASPLWDIELTFNFLRSDANAELQAVIGFLLARAGQAAPFLFAPPGGLGVVHWRGARDRRRFDPGLCRLAGDRRL